MSAATINVDAVRFVKELYPRLKPHDEVVERYRDALDQLPPITVARDGVLVDGYHRWQAHVREGAKSILAENLGNLTDAEIVRESIQRNATHGQQLTRKDKERLSAQLWTTFAAMDKMEREKEISALLAVSSSKVREWTKDERKAEQEQLRAAVVDDWLNCSGSDRAIAERHEVDHKSVAAWSGEYCQTWQNSPPESQQHFDVWSFQTADKDAGQQSYFGALPPQVVENLLWLYTEPGQTVVDSFAGSGTTIEVAKAMGRRIWASDRIGNRYSPHLPIHEHDARSGWADDAPAKADIVILDPPYWQQAKGRYSEDAADLGNQDLADFYAAWALIAKAAMEHAGLVVYIISPTQLDDGHVVDHATDMLAPFHENGWRVERRIIVTYQTQQATGQQVTWARENKRLLKLYRDLVVMAK